MCCKTEDQWSQNHDQDLSEVVSGASRPTSRHEDNNTEWSTLQLSINHSRIAVDSCCCHCDDCLGDNNEFLEEERPSIALSYIDLLPVSRLVTAPYMIRIFTLSPSTVCTSSLEVLRHCWVCS